MCIGGYVSGLFIYRLETFAAKNGSSDGIVGGCEMGGLVWRWRGGLDGMGRDYIGWKGEGLRFFGILGGWVGW